MKRIFFLLCLASPLFLLAKPIIVKDLSCEYKVNPIGIDESSPRLSWKLSGSERDILQSAYEVRVASNKSFGSGAVVWASGKVNSDASVLVPYAGNALKPSTRYYWQVRIWDAKGQASDWSTPAWFETGLLKPANWTAQWIEPVQSTERHMPGLLLRKEFAVAKKVASARAYVTSHGFYEFYLNGNKVGDQVLTPGWTSYTKRLQYQVYDVTSLLQTGKNCGAAMLGDGWYRGSLAWENNWGIWGKQLGLLCEIKIAYTDGSEETIVSDNGWKSSQDGPITLNGIYDGESYDARKEMKGWNKAGFDDKGWQNVQVKDIAKNNLIDQQTVPVRRIQEIHPTKIFTTPKGLLVADFGQNMVGWIRLKVKGSAGTVVTIRHAEVLDKYGDFYTDNLRAAAATARYTLRGGEEETWEPRFSFFGFRYASVAGFPGQLKPEDITGVVVHSDMQPSGSFECSNALINQLQHNIQWGQKGNFLDVPTDCPQRDERLGWTGDAQAFSRTAAFNMNVAPFFTKWLKDVAADQLPDGAVPFVIPDVLRNNGTSAGWGDVSTIVPWNLYQVYGDKLLLETQYPSMKAYVDYIRSKAGSTWLWKGGSVFGDWLFYKSMQQTENDGYTSPDMIATMFFALSANLVSKAAAVLGKTEDAKTYADAYAKIKEAFNHNYVTAEGRIASESQTAYVLALSFDLLPEALREKATGYLVDDIRSRGNHLSTGFLGTPYLCHVLTAQGRTDVAYDLLLQETFPSWLYPVKMGATTIWERWDGQKTDSSFQDVGMNSFNHYAYGAIGDWMYRVCTGIEIGAPGYKHIILKPQPGQKLGYAKASYESVYGTIASGWEMKDGKMKVDMKVPANTTATIILPAADASQVMESGAAIQSAFKLVKQEGANTVIEAGSGEYHFEYAAKTR